MIQIRTTRTAQTAHIAQNIKKVKLMQDDERRNLKIKDRRSQDKIENSEEFKEIMRSTKTKPIRILEKTADLIEDFCDGKIITPSQWASEHLTKEILYEIEKINNQYK